MNSDRRRRGRGKDRRDDFGDGGFDYQPQDMFQPYERPDSGPSAGGSRGGFQDRDGGGHGGARGGGGGMPAQVVGTGAGTVKFFNSQKGFGFIQCDDRPDDVFVHISAVEAAGLQGLAEGQALKFTLVDRRGKVSATELEIDGDLIPVTASRPPRDDRGGDRGGFDRDRRPRRELTGEKGRGKVKFFNESKGFGFIEREDGQADAFVHISAVERSGLGRIDEGDYLEFDIEQDNRGKYAAVNLSRVDD